MCVTLSPCTQDWVPASTACAIPVLGPGSALLAGAMEMPSAVPSVGVWKEMELPQSLTVLTVNISLASEFPRPLPAAAILPQPSGVKITLPDCFSHSPDL